MDPNVPLTMKELEQQARAPLPCPLCRRPNREPSEHHLIPRTRGGTTTTTICRDCHSAIHATFSNKQLERQYSTIEALLGHAEFAATIRFISKQDGKVRTRIARSQKGRHRNG